MNAHHFCYAIENAFNSYLSRKQVTSAESPYIFLDKATLQIAGQSIFLDIERMKKAHQIEFPDKHKYAGFTTRWISKLKPIQIDSSKLDKRRGFTLINEGVAIHAGLTFLQMKHKNIKHHKLVVNLAYTLLYRDPRPEELALIYYLIEYGTCCRNALPKETELPKILENENLY